MKSASPDLTNQKIQYYSDATCTTPSGILVDLSSSSAQSRSFSAPAFGTTYAFKVISIDGSGNQSESACSGSMQISALSVEAAYSNGTKWNDYVKNDAADIYNAGNLACAGTENGYSACIHGGEMRAVTLEGVTSCNGISMTDALGAFDWTCAIKNGNATFFSRLKSAKGLRDLVDAAAWKNNSITLSGTTTGTSASTTWWTNVIMPLPDNSDSVNGTDTVIRLDGTNDGGNDAVYAEGTIFTLATSRSTSGYNVNRDKMAIVTFSGATLTYNGRNTNNCADSTGETAAADEKDVVCAGNQKFLWFEGDFDATTGGVATDAGIQVVDVVFSRFQNVNAKAVWALTLEGTSKSNLIRNYASAGAAGLNSGLDFFNGASFNAIEGATISGYPGKAAINMDTNVDNNTFSDLTLSSSAIGILNYSSVGSNDGNSFTNVVIKDIATSSYGIALSGTTNSTFRNIKLSNVPYGITTYAGTANTGHKFYDLTIANSYLGIYLVATASGNLFHRFSISNSAAGAIHADGGINTASNSFIEGIVLNTGASYDAIDLRGSDNNNLIRITTINNGFDGLSLSNGSDLNTIHQVLSSNNGNGLAIWGTSNSTGNTFSQIASTNNTRGVYLENRSNSSKFTGTLLVGNNSTADCGQTGGTNPGLVDATCTTAGTDGSSAYTGGFVSDAVLRINRTAASSFVGKVSADDTSNSSDTNGTAAFPADPTTFDWSGFSSLFLGWGEDGSAFPNADHRGEWAAGTGRIWDLRLLATDTQFLDKSEDGTGLNQAFVAGGACPSAADGNRVAVDQKTIPNTYLLNAVEIVDPLATGYSATGDHDGLCESAEACIYAPNFGAYQGHGALETCIFSDGTITGVTLYGYASNGVTP